MPLYEYARSACDSRFERLQPIPVARQADCPGYGIAAKRALSGFVAPVAGYGRHPPQGLTNDGANLIAVTGGAPRIYTWNPLPAARPAIGSRQE